jgi:DNA primase
MIARRDLARELRRTAPLDDPHALAVALGLGERAQRQPRGVIVRCPWHDDRTPSCSVRVAGDGTIAVRCHACGATADALGLLARVHGLDVRRDWRAVLDEAARLTGGAVPELRGRADVEPDERPDDETYDAIASALLDACGPLRDCPDVASYLDARGIYADADAAGVRGLPCDCGPLVAELLATYDRGALERAGVVRGGHDAIDWLAWRVLMPWRDRYGRITCIQRRRLDGGEPRYRCPPGRSPRAPYGVDLLAMYLDAHGADCEIVVVEGALDCLARRRIARHRGEPCAVLGVYSASTPCAGLPLDLLAGRRVVLACDADDAGERACAELAGALRGVARELVRQRPPAPHGDWGSSLATEAA